MGFSFIIEENTALTFPVRDLTPTKSMHSIHKQELETVLIEKKCYFYLLLFLEMTQVLVNTDKAG